MPVTHHSQEQNLWGISITGFDRLDVLFVTQPAASKHRTKLKALTSTTENHPLASSLLHPPRENEILKKSVKVTELRFYIPLDTK